MVRKGFTLIELIVVIAIIAVLAAVVAPNAFKAVERAKIAGTISDYKAVKTATMAYYSDCGIWPGDLANLTTSDTGRCSEWDGPYLEKQPSPRFGTSSAITYVNGSSGPFGVTSRFINITSVPEAAVRAIEKAIDGGSTPDYDSGFAQNTSGTVSLLLTADGTVD